MYCIVVQWSDRSGIVAIFGPWRDIDDATLVAKTLSGFAEDKCFDVTAMHEIIFPATVS